MKVLNTLSSDCQSYKDGQREYFFHCPGCNTGHCYVTQWSEERKKNSKYGAPTWDFNGNMEKPTFTPSLLYRWNNPYSGKDHVCHLFITDGVIQYLSDCTHCYAGKHVKMVDVNHD